MKRVFLTLIYSLFISFSFGQTKIFPETKSKVFRVECDTQTYSCKMFGLGGDFTRTKSKNFMDNFNLEKVRKLMVESLIEYRADYGVFTNISEDKILTYQSNIWAEKLSSQFRHATIKERGNCSEVISKYPISIFYHVSDSLGDINKLVAETLFDNYTSSYAHHTILIDKSNIDWGFGIFIDDNDYIYTCFRAK